MKRITVIVASAAALVVIVFAFWVIFMMSESPDTGVVTCPMYISSSLAQSLGPSHQMERWEVYSYEGTKGAPKVKVRPSSIVPDSVTPRSCELRIIWAPEQPGSASDWRIGHIVSYPEPLRGRNVTFRVLMKGSHEFQFDTSMIYIHDGVKVLGATFPRVTRDWQSFQVTAQVDPRARVFEVWVRFLLDKGTIRPGSGSLYFVALVEG